MSSANSRNPAADDDDISFSIEALVAQLQHDSEDLDASLQNFLQDRANAVEMQKRALVEYEEEMARIEAEYNALEYGIIDPPKKTVDHNILKHLNIDRRTEFLANEAKAEAERDQEERDNADNVSRISMSFPERKKKFGDQFLLDQNVPPPSFEEKKKAREQMFDHFEESTIEETRLELELEQARERGDTKLIDELSDALLYIQRMNNEKLNDLVNSYRPTLFGKNWGNDPDYIQMSKQLKNISDAFYQSSTQSDTLPDVQPPANAGSKASKKKSVAPKKH